MKALLAIAATLFATSAFAATETITCAYNSNSDLMMDIKVDTATGQVLGAGLYNQDWGQTGDGTFKVTKAVGVVNPMAGLQVVLADNQTLDIDWTVLETGHNGAVILNSQDEYHCF